MTRRCLVAATILMTGCVTTLPAVLPITNIPVTVPTEWTGLADTGDRPGIDWWTDFGDTALDEIVYAALEQNYDLRAAAARVEQAAADSRMAAAGLQRTVQAGLNGSRRKQIFIDFPIPGS